MNITKYILLIITLLFFAVNVFTAIIPSNSQIIKYNTANKTSIGSTNILVDKTTDLLAIVLDSLDYELRHTKIKRDTNPHSKKILEHYLKYILLPPTANYLLTKNIIFTVPVLTCIYKDKESFKSYKNIIIKQENFKPFNNFINDYKPNIYDELYVNLENNFINLIKILNSYWKIPHFQSFQQYHIKTLLNLKNKIDNMLWKNGIPPGNPLLTLGYPDFNSDDKIIYKNIINGIIDFSVTGKIERIKIIKDIQNELILMYKKFANLFNIVKNMHKYIKDGQRITTYSCTEIYEYTSKESFEYKISNYYNFTCKFLEILNAMQILLTWLGREVIYSKKYFDNGTSGIYDDTRYKMATAKLHLYVIQHLYALYVIKIKFDGLNVDYTITDN